MERARQPVAPNIKHLQERLHQQTQLQFALEHGRRRKRHAGLLLRGLHHQHRAVELRAARRRQLRAGGLRPGAPVVAALGAQQGEAAQVLRPQQMQRHCRRAKRCERRRQQGLGRLAAPSAVAEANGRI